MGLYDGLGISVELVPFALTPDGLWLGCLSSRSDTTGGFVIPSVAFDINEFDHPLASAHALAQSLLSPGTWSSSNLTVQAGWRYGTTGTLSNPQLIFTIAMVLTFPIPFLTYRDLRVGRAYQPVWQPWSVANEPRVCVLDYMRPDFDPKTCYATALQALTAVREELGRHPERLSHLFDRSAPAHAQASLVQLYGHHSSKAALRAVIASAFPRAA